MKVLLLGGAGFVGSCLTRKLVEIGDSVTVIDLQVDQKVEGAEYSLFDCMEQGRLSDFLESRKYDVVIDFCCMTVAHMKMIIPIMNKLAVHFILCSTVSVYDFEKALIYPIVETTSRKDSYNSEYGAEKAQCEDILIQTQKEFNYTIMRPCYVYGLDCQNNRLEFVMDKVIMDEPIIVSNDPESVFPLLHVEELADAIIEMRKDEKVYGQVMNICPDELISLRKLVKLVALFDNKDNKFIVDKEKNIYINKFYNFSICFSNEKIKRLTGWRPSKKLYDGIKEVYEHRKKILKEKGCVDGECKKM